MWFTITSVVVGGTDWTADQHESIGLQWTRSTHTAGHTWTGQWWLRSSSCPVRIHSGQVQQEQRLHLLNRCPAKTQTSLSVVRQCRRNRSDTSSTDFRRKSLAKLFTSLRRYVKALSGRIDNSNYFWKSISLGLHICVGVSMRISAVGCSNLVPPSEAWLRRTDNEATIGCYTTRQRWNLRCHDNRWIGTIGVCSSDGIPVFLVQLLKCLLCSVTLCLLWIKRQTRYLYNYLAFFWLIERYETWASYRVGICCVLRF